MQTAPLGSLARVWQPNRLTATQVNREHGTPFFAATQAFDIKPKARKWLAESRTPDLKRRWVEGRWILVTCSGNVGESILSYAPHAGVIISHDLLRVNPRDTSDTGFLYAFLRSSYGRAMMRSSKYGNIIKHLEPEHLDELPVPLVEERLRKSLASDVKQVFDLRDEAFSLVEKADKRYVEALGLKSEHLDDESAFTVSSSELFSGSRRLDGFHYNPEAEAASRALASSQHKLVPLEEIVADVYGVPRFKHLYSKTGIPYVDSEDLFKVNPTLEKFIPAGAKKNAQDYFVERDWLLMACSGQLYGLNGSVVLAGSWHENKIISNHVLRIQTQGHDGLRPGYLQVALSHIVFGRPLVLRYAFGTEVPEISPEDVKRILVIDPPTGLENEIANLVETARDLRTKADLLENTLVARLEEALAGRIGPPAEVPQSGIGAEE
jgi:hypothetical protein